MSRALGLKPEILDEHIQYLERRHRIHAGAGRSRRFYPGSDERRFLVHLHSDLSLVVLERLRAEPGSRVGELARSLDLSRSRVRRHLRTLDEQGLVRRSGEWRTRFHACPGRPATPRQLSSRPWPHKAS